MDPDSNTPLATGDELDPREFPALWDLSPALLFTFVPTTPSALAPTEFVYVDTPDLHWSSAVTTWNQFWEAGDLRPRLLSGSLEDKLGRPLPVPFDLPRKIRARFAELPNVNICLIPRAGRSKYAGYAPLHHLLPLRTIQRFGLPTLRRGFWPPLIDLSDGFDEVIPKDYEARLGQAVMFHVWPILSPGISVDLGSASSPLRLIAHNLDFWLPYADILVKKRIAARGRVVFSENATAADRRRLQRIMPEEITLNRPYFGGFSWMGEDEAWEATRELVETADRYGRLYEIMDSFRTHSTKDDFSPHWNADRESFERGLYGKRAKVKVSFVELPDTLPVQGPRAQVLESLVWQSLMVMLDQEERHVVVCLRNSTTRAPELSEIFGYADDGVISKELVRIRQKVGRILGVTGDGPVASRKHASGKPRVKNLQFERECRRHQYHEHSRQITITGNTPRAGQNIVDVDGKELVLGDSDLVLLLALVRELRKGEGGRIPTDDLIANGYLPQAVDQAVLRLRNKLRPLINDAAKLIERPGDKTIRLSIHPSLVTVSDEVLSQHVDQRVRQLAGSLQLAGANGPRRAHKA